MIDSEMKAKIGSKNSTKHRFYSKLAVILVLVFAQIAMSIMVYSALKQYVIYWRTGALLLSALVVLYIVNKQDNPAYKLAWVVLVLIAPLIGGALYVILAGNRTRRKFIEEALENYTDTFQYFPDDSSKLEKIKEQSKSANIQATYISKTAGYPVYENTEVKYFAVGEENFKELTIALNKAKHFIFMEYFIIKQGEMWEEILGILAKKAEEGVDVRIIYDDFGCAMWIPSRFTKDMERLGIRVAAFNPISPTLSLRQNNRDHRKITVVDGYIGFTGGINIADEYINKISPFGHWKDTGVMLTGEAVWNLTVMFLQSWTMLTGETDNYSLFKPDLYAEVSFASDGFIQPYGDTPVDDEIVGENIYLNMINKAKHYVYITTPYLIIDNEMQTALTLAAKSGIDVRIITPGIPDKKAVYLVTQSNYYYLIKAGVKIYQYTPGFIHAKTVFADDSVATVGTINMDYRSLYLHFECGVFMYDSSVIAEIKNDYIKTLEECDEITIDDIAQYGVFKRFNQSILRLISPLL